MRLHHLPCRRRTQPTSLLGDGFGRAFADAGTAVDAVTGVDAGLSVLHGDSRDGAGTDTGFAADAFFFIDFCRHVFLLFSSLDIRRSVPAGRGPPADPSYINAIRRKVKRCFHPPHRRPQADEKRFAGSSAKAGPLFAIEENRCIVDNGIRKEIGA